MKKALGFFLFAACLSARAAEPVTKIGDLYLVHMPSRDHNSAFTHAAKHFADVLEAAREKKLKVHLINFDALMPGATRDEPAKGRYLNEEIAAKEIAKLASKTEPYWMVLATHGEQARAETGESDTVLDFGTEGVRFSKLLPTLQETPVVGLSLMACQSLNDTVRKPPFPVTASAEGKNNANALQNSDSAILRKAVLSKKPIRIGTFLQDTVAGIKDRKTFTVEAVKGNDPTVLFEGKEFSLVDHEGEPVKLCSKLGLFPGMQMKVSDIPQSKDFTRPRHWIISSAATDDTPTLFCRSDGSLAFTPPRHCYSDQTKLSLDGITVETCAKTLADRSKETPKATSEKLCRELVEQAKLLSDLGVTPLGEHCLKDCKAVGGHFPAEQSGFYPAGTCSPLGNGASCSLSDSGRETFLPECCGSHEIGHFKLDEKNQCAFRCFDKKTVKEPGPEDCFSLERGAYWAAHASLNDAFPKQIIFSEKDELDPSETIRGANWDLPMSFKALKKWESLPLFSCATGKGPKGEKVQVPYFSEACCKAQAGYEMREVGISRAGSQRSTTSFMTACLLPPKAPEPGEPKAPKPNH